MKVNFNVFLIKKIIHYFKKKSAVVAIEFALIVPVIVFMFGGMVEYANQSYAIQKNISASNAIANIVADLGSLESHSLLFGVGLAEINIKGMAVKNSRTITTSNGGTGTLESFLGAVVTIIGVYPVETSPGVFANRPFVFYQQSFGATNLITSRFAYNRGTPQSNVDQAYYDANKINASALNGITFENNQQYIIVETAFQYAPIFNFANILPITTIKYENPPTVPRIKAFMFLPDGGVGRVI
jgi:Flp pilus assembly protein TadG